MQNKNTRRGFTQINKNVVICPPCGESQGQRPQSRKVGMREPGKGVVNKETLLDNPPSALRATSPTLGGKSTTRGFILRRHAELVSASSRSIKGFTLIELLVVVLIIGILAAVAVPQYQKAVLKSRYATLMPIAKAMADAQEVYYLNKGYYAQDDEKDLLDVSSAATEKSSVALSQTDGYDYVLAQHTDIPQAHYIMYQKHSTNYPAEIHCEAQTNDTLANWLCKEAFQGKEITHGSLSAGYTTYVLSGSENGIYYTALEQKAKDLCGSNCEYIVDEENQTITTCDTNYASIQNGNCIPYAASGGSSIATSVSCPNGAQLCVYSYEGRATLENGYNHTYDKDGQLISTIGCSSYEQGTCTATTVSTNLGGGAFLTQSRTCKVGGVSADGLTCEGGYSSGVDILSLSSGQMEKYKVYQYDAEGTLTGSQFINPQEKFSYLMVHNEALDGTITTSRLGSTCAASNYYYGLSPSGITCVRKK